MSEGCVSHHRRTIIHMYMYSHPHRCEYCSCQVTDVKEAANVVEGLPSVIICNFVLFSFYSLWTKNLELISLPKTKNICIFCTIPSENL